MLSELGELLGPVLQCCCYRVEFCALEAVALAAFLPA